MHLFHIKSATYSPMSLTDIPLHQKGSSKFLHISNEENFSPRHNVCCLSDIHLRNTLVYLPKKRHSFFFFFFFLGFYSFNISSHPFEFRLYFHIIVSICLGCISSHPLFTYQRKDIPHGELRVKKAIVYI